MTKKKVYPLDLYPYVSKEYLGLLSIFSDPDYDVEFVPGFVADSPADWIVGIPAYINCICNRYEHSFLMYDYRRRSIQVGLLFTGTKIASESAQRKLVLGKFPISPRYILRKKSPQMSRHL